MKQSDLKKIADAAIKATMHAIASKVYGKGLWSKFQLIAVGTISNSYDKPLPADLKVEEIRSLKGGAMYFQKNKFGDTQILVKYEDGGWSYASVLRDKEGEFITSEDNKYEVHEVVAQSTSKFTPEGGEEITIEKGFMTLKAYAL